MLYCYYTVQLVQMFRRITVGLKGGILRVASAAEVAARLLLLVGGAPGRRRACPAHGPALRQCPWGAVGGLLDHAGETDRLPVCGRRWPLALVCLRASGFGGAGLRIRPPSPGGGAFLLSSLVPVALAHYYREGPPGWAEHPLRNS